MRKFILLLLLISVLIGFASNWPPTRIYLLLALDKAEYIDRKLRWRLGLPLRGTPDLEKLNQRLAQKGLNLGDPIFMRIFKREHELELWVKKGDKFSLFEKYPICRWSGKLGPKLKRGDRQAPEGFYTVSRQQLNPNSRWYRSFNLGYPNLLDKSFGRTGDYLMVHGGCSSIGCYAMTNAVISELWEFVTKALDGGQARFHVHVLPFRLNELNLTTHKHSPWYSFWSDLQKGSDIFESTSIPPNVSVCDRRYQVTPGKSGSQGNSAINTRCNAHQSPQARLNFRGARPR